MNDVTGKPAAAQVHTLASDLDGTLIPLCGDPRNLADLQTLGQELHDNDVMMVFVTGRHFASVAKAMDEFHLPRPAWIICDVGTSIFQRQASGEYEQVLAYEQYQDQIIAPLPLPALCDILKSLPGLRLQEEAKQGRFKLSFYAEAAQLGRLVDSIQTILSQVQAPYSIVHSVDPFNGDGLIDLLPADVSKSHALAWWSQHIGVQPEAIVFAGDSGNDLAPLTAGYRAIVVGNADRQLARQIHEIHRQSDWCDRLYLARGAATSGVLEGCRWFGLAKPDEPPVHRLGATPVSHDMTHFRVWAPRRISVAVEVHADGEKTRQALTRTENGYFIGNVPNARSNSLYQYVLDDHVARPDPVSNYQPQGVHGPSQIINSTAFPWTDQGWPGVAKRDLVIYELHVGTYTEPGTFRAASECLDQLVELGITAVEIMPVAQSPGRWNWGYDGVGLFAVRNTYGEPDDFRAFVDDCHGKGLAVILDVVYNHLGPEGNYLADFGPYFSRQHHTPWGQAFNFDGRHSKPVRQFIVDNAIYWLEEFHLDGLRLDAVHYMLDDGQPTILDEIRRAVSDYANSTGRTLHLIAEANLYDDSLLTGDEGRQPYDAIWCDCLMHSVYSLALPDLRLTRRKYCGASDLARALRYGYVYVGREQTRISESDRQQRHAEDGGAAYLTSLVTAIQTHDAVGNHPHGKRLHQLTSKAFQKAVAGLALLYPSIPLIFMGEEYALDAPFPFFADFEDARLRSAVDQGRAREYTQHDWRGAPLPSAAETFYRAKCHRVETHDMDMFAWYQSLLALRREGLAQGWLSPAQMTVGFDNQDIFSLRFARVEGVAVAVHARLMAVERPDLQPVHIDLEGQLLLSSRSNTETAGNQVLLMPNHVVISG